MRKLESLLNKVGGEMPPHVFWALSDPSHHQEDLLYPVERAVISRAIVKRRNEFAAGRLAARKAMISLGHEACAVPMAEDRSPVWPTGLTGSISHTASACIALVAKTEHVRAVGVDIEPNESIDPELISTICSIEELALIGGPTGLAARRIFSAKEAVYKAQFPITRTLFGFDALAVTAADCGTLTLTFQRNVAPIVAKTRITIRQWTGCDTILSIATLAD